MNGSSTQHWDPRQYAEQARYVSELGMPVVDLLSPQPGERILDLGCGDGVLSIRLRNMGCQVVGVDASPEMVEAARALGIDARVIDARAMDFDGEFDAVFSNATLHWIRQQQPVIAGVWRALKPGGRFVGELGGYGNVRAIVTALAFALSARGRPFNKPWFFPRAEEYQRLLETVGFSVNTITLFPRPTPLPGDVGDWLRTFAGSCIGSLPAGERVELIREVIHAVRGTLSDENGNWKADYVRLRFSATKPQVTA